MITTVRRARGDGGNGRDRRLSQIALNRSNYGKSLCCNPIAMDMSYSRS